MKKDQADEKNEQGEVSPKLQAEIRRIKERSKHRDRLDQMHWEQKRRAHDEAQKLDVVPARVVYGSWSLETLREACNTWLLYWQGLCNQHRFDELTEVLCCAARERKLDPTVLVKLAHQYGDGSMGENFVELYRPARELLTLLQADLDSEAQSEGKEQEMIAQKIAGLIREDPLFSKRFQEQLVEFGRKNVAYQRAVRAHNEAVAEHRQRVLKDSRLRDRQAGPPESGYEWREFAMDDPEGGADHASGTPEPLAGWFPAPVDLPEDPWVWSGNRTGPITHEDLLLSSYTLLACCHDNQLRDDRAPLIEPDMVATKKDQAETGLELFYTPPGSSGTNLILAANRHRLSTAYDEVVADLGLQKRAQSDKPAQNNTANLGQFETAKRLAEAFVLPERRVSVALSRAAKIQPHLRRKITDPKARGAKFLYVTELVTPILEELKRNTSRNTKKK